MNLILFFDKCKEKLTLEYRKYIIRKKINCTHSNFKVYGKILLINHNVRLGKNVRIYPGVMLFGDGLIEIGDNVSIGNDTMIYASKNGGVRIGDNSQIAAQSYIIDMNHGIARNELIKNQPNTVLPISIGKDVWIAANVTIIKGSNIGDGAVIGAKSLVNGEIEPYSICVGIPAKKIKMRI